MKKITKADLIYAYLFSIKYFVPNSITTMNFVRRTLALHDFFSAIQIIKGTDQCKVFYKISSV